VPKLTRAACARMWWGGVVGPCGGVVRWWGGCGEVVVVWWCGGVVGWWGGGVVVLVVWWCWWCW
jgi:hypothetical protein